MNIGIASVCYNGYGKFLNQWLKSIDGLTTKPNEIVLVLGKNHGVEDLNSLTSRGDVKVIDALNCDNMGKLRNLALTHLTTEWVVSLDFDDVLLPWAIEEFEKNATKDVIVSKYLVLGEKNLCVHPRITIETLLSEEYYLGGPNYLHSASPFKRSLWLRNPYQENECSNALFWIDLAADGATFSHTDKIGRAHV